MLQFDANADADTTAHALCEWTLTELFKPQSQGHAKLTAFVIFFCLRGGSLFFSHREIAMHMALRIRPTKVDHLNRHTF